MFVPRFLTPDPRRLNLPLLVALPFVVLAFRTNPVQDTVVGPHLAVHVAADTGQDSARRQATKAREARRAALEAKREIPLTPALLASAYDGPLTRTLLTRAREARLADDSAIHRYDANSLERFSVWLTVGSIGRERLLLRRDRAEHVRWERGLGAIVDVTGSRAAMPMVPPGNDANDDVEDMDQAIALPYAPGRRTLALGGERGADTTQYTEIDDIIDPLAPGAEAYYRYSLGDSEAVSLPTRTGGRRRIQLREVRLHPRQPIWNIAEGSLWFDVANGHLVRAVYRFAAPMDIVAVAKDADPDAFKDVPFWVKPMIMPMTATLDAVTLDYGLFDDRYWLLIERYADGNAKVNLFRARVRWEVRYQYLSVNGRDSLPHLAEFIKPLEQQHNDNNAAVHFDSSRQARPNVGATPAVGAMPARPWVQAAAPPKRKQRGSGHLDMRSGAEQSAQTDSAERARRAAQCARQSTWDHVEVHDGGAVRVLVRTPCDTAALAHSPLLPPSIYDPGETVFGEHDATAILARLGTEPEPDFAPRAPQLRWGLDDNLIRYNRIEGLSVGAAVVDQLGLGLTTRIEGRMGEADLEPNAELQVARNSASGTVSAGVYRRLASANDWGDPFTVGSSIWNLLAGDDEGFYYRAWGGELQATQTAALIPYSWRLFTEREWGARVDTRFSLTDAVGGAGMSRQNVAADAGTLAGLAFRLRPSWGTGLDGFQMSADVRGEGAGGDYTYARGAADVTLLHPVSRYLDAAVTGGAGTSAGDVPAQRDWFLGGLRTIRGIAPGQDVGDAYWMAHGEIGLRSSFVRPLVFFDMGWAGDRSDWGREGRPLSGAGIGVSLLDGLIRFDVAHGIAPTHGLRINAYWQGTL